MHIDKVKLASKLGDVYSFQEGSEIMGMVESCCDRGATIADERKRVVVILSDVELEMIGRIMRGSGASKYSEVLLEALSIYHDRFRFDR